MGMAKGVAKGRLRLDQPLVEKGWLDDLREPRARVMAAEVRVYDPHVTKPGTEVRGVPAIAGASTGCGLALVDLTCSPLRGSGGTLELLALVSDDTEPVAPVAELSAATLRSAAASG